MTTSDTAIKLARMVRDWARTPQDHGGNPYRHEFARFALKILEREDGQEDEQEGSLFIELRSEDVGKRLLRAFGHTWCLTGVLDSVQDHDIGRRLYLTPMEDGSWDILRAESDDQRTKRLGR